MTELPLSEFRNMRLKKIEDLRNLGLNPFATKSLRSHYAKTIVDDFESYESREVTVAGRLLLWRPHGSLVFANIQDQSGSIQLLIEKKSLAATDPANQALGFKDLKLLDIGDIVEATGVVMKTHRGEVSVHAKCMKILTKSIRPMPEKWHGLKDREAILRRRYLYSISQPQFRDRFDAISRMLHEIRNFLNEKGFLEFHTPVLQPQYGGGTAKPFTTHLNALNCRMYLAISHELYLKRLITAGFDKVYTIGRYFRNEGIDKSHHPEFSMIETMTAYENYEYNMALVEDLFRHVATRVFGKTCFSVRGNEIDFSKPWKRVMMLDAVKETTGLDFSQCNSVDEANQKLESIGLKEPQASVGKALLYAFEEKVAETLIQPTLVYGHPVDVSPLAKPMPSDPKYTERFEIFIGGMECGDNWSEQNDPLLQLATWEKALETRSDTDDEIHPIDYDFVETLEYGMPPTTGIGPGIERMAMIFLEEENIDEVIFFPIMKPVLSPLNAAIYGVDKLFSAEQSRRDEIAFTLEEFQALLKDGLIRPETEGIVIYPYLQVWSQPSKNGAWKASGCLEIEGFYQGSRLIVSGYSVESREPLDSSSETGKFGDTLMRGLIKAIKESFPGCEIKTEKVELVNL